MHFFSLLYVLHDPLICHLVQIDIMIFGKEKNKKLPTFKNLVKQNILLPKCIFSIFKWVCSAVGVLRFLIMNSHKSDFAI